MQLIFVIVIVLVVVFMMRSATSGVFAGDRGAFGRRIAFARFAFTATTSTAATAARSIGSLRTIGVAGRRSIVGLDNFRIDDFRIDDVDVIQIGMIQIGKFVFRIVNKAMRFQWRKIVVHRLRLAACGTAFFATLRSTTAATATTTTAARRALGVVRLFAAARPAISERCVRIGQIGFERLVERIKNIVVGQIVTRFGRGTSRTISRRFAARRFAT